MVSRKKTVPVLFFEYSLPLPKNLFPAVKSTTYANRKYARDRTVQKYSTEEFTNMGDTSSRMWHQKIVPET